VREVNTLKTADLGGDGDVAGEISTKPSTGLAPSIIRQKTPFGAFHNSLYYLVFQCAIQDLNLKPAD